MSSKKVTADDLIIQLNGARPKEQPFVRVSTDQKEEEYADVVWWRVVQRGKSQWLEVENTKFLLFLQSKGYFKIYVGKNPVLIRKENNVFEEISPANIKDFVLSYLDQMPVVLPRIEGAYTSNELKNLVLKQVAYFFGEGFLFALETIQFNRQRDTAFTAFFYYRNGFVQITRESIVLLPYTQLKGHIWKSQIIDRDFIYEEQEGKSLTTEYAVFMYHVAGKDAARFSSLQSIVGFLLHSFKSQSNPACVILLDEVLSDSPEGGTGKGIFISGLKQLKKTVTIDGKTFKFDKSFVWQRLELGTQLLAFEDVLKKFEFEKLFSILTEGINVEKKNMQEFYIPFEDAPKVIITTNYAIEGQGNSHERRRIEYEFAQYYNAQNTPAKEFGHLLFTDWEESEWQRFDNWMIWCVRFYLANGVVKYKGINIQRKKLIYHTCEEFAEYHDGLQLNQEYENRELFTAFTSQFPDYSKLTEKKFFYWVGIAAKLKLKFNTVTKRKSGPIRFVTLSYEKDTSTD